uniref:Uncharacterized protein n=1 Tax=Cucumis melo TaxID=3656 RepID=A0A9I9EHI3_CUCME
MNENQVDHPIWFVTIAGLQPSVINSITVCKYKKSQCLIEGTDCSVCLSEFQEDEIGCYQNVAACFILIVLILVKTPNFKLSNG